MIRMNHEQFIGLCKKSGIQVEKITETEVFLYTTITPREIDLDLSHPDDPTRVIRNLLQNNNKLWIVRIIKTYTGLGLKECVDLHDRGLKNWTVQLVETIPYHDLPRYLDSSRYCDTYYQAILGRLRA